MNNTIFILMTLFGILLLSSCGSQGVGQAFEIPSEPISSTVPQTETNEPADKNEPQQEEAQYDGIFANWQEELGEEQSFKFNAFSGLTLGRNLISNEIKQSRVRCKKGKKCQPKKQKTCFYRLKKTLHFLGTATEGVVHYVIEKKDIKGAKSCRFPVTKKQSQFVYFQRESQMNFCNFYEKVNEDESHCQALNEKN